MTVLRKTCSVAILLALGAALLAMASSVEGIAARGSLCDVQYLPSAEFLEKAALGYRTLAADLMWFTTIQYYGEAKLQGRDLTLFDHLIETTTRLDPRFSYVYLFGSLILSEEIGDFERGIDLLEQGMTQMPDDWALPFEAGFLYYVNRKDYEEAARYFERASRMPGAPDRTRRFAAFVYDRAGHTVNAIRMWQDLYEHSENPHMRKLAEENIEKLARQLEEERGSPAPAGASSTATEPRLEPGGGNG